MKTDIKKQFEVDKSIDIVWEHFAALDKIVSCVPGAKLTEKIDDKNYKGEVELKIGPIKAKYGGLIEFLELNATEHVMKLKGTGVDEKGKGSADMILQVDLKTVEDKTSVNVSMEVSVTGMIAQFGSRLIYDATNQIFDQFVANFKSFLNGQKVDNTLSAAKMVGGTIKNIFK